MYPKEYQEMFIKSIYDSHTTYHELEPFVEKTSVEADKFAEFKIKAGYKMKSSQTIEEAKKRNELSPARVV